MGSGDTKEDHRVEDTKLPKVITQAADRTGTGETEDLKVVRRAREWGPRYLGV